MLTLKTKITTTTDGKNILNVASKGMTHFRNRHIQLYCCTTILAQKQIYTSLIHYYLVNCRSSVKNSVVQKYRKLGVVLLYLITCNGICISQVKLVVVWINICVTPTKNEVFTRSWSNVGTSSTMRVQHHTHILSASGVWWGLHDLPWITLDQHWSSLCLVSSKPLGISLTMGGRPPIYLRSTFVSSLSHEPTLT